MTEPKPFPIKCGQCDETIVSNREPDDGAKINCPKCNETTVYTKPAPKDETPKPNK